MSEQTTTLETLDYQNRAFLYVNNAPEPEAGDVLLYAGELLHISELASAELLGIPTPLFSVGDEDYVAPSYQVDGKEYKTANAAAVDFILNRLGGTAGSFVDTIKLPVFVIRRRVFESPDTPEALQLVGGRREEQNRSHGGPKHDDTHSLADWRGFLHDYFGQIETKFNEIGNLDLPLSSGDAFQHIFPKLVDIAALGVAMLETGIRAARLQPGEEAPAFKARIELADENEVVEPTGLKLTPYSELKDKYVGEPGSLERLAFDLELEQEIKESQAHQERLLALKQIDSEEDYKAVMQLLLQMSDAQHPELADMEHLGQLANAYEIAQGHEPPKPKKKRAPAKKKI
jgi:hypothetical protein